MTVKEKMTAPIASVGADVEQPLQNFKTNQSIADLPGKGNLQATNNAENTAKSANKKNPDDLETVSMMELYDTAYPPKLPIIDGLLYNGTYLFVGSPKIGKSFFMAQIGYHISKGLPLWGFSVRQGTVLYLALEDDYARLQKRLSQMFGMEGSENFYFATKSKSLNDGLERQLVTFVTEHKDARLIIIDIVTQERDGINQQISFSEIAINNPKRVAEGDYRVTHYKVQRTNEKISTLVHKKNDPTTIYFQFEQKKYDETELDVHADFLRLGIEQQGQCKAFYKEICPYVIESVLTRDKDNKVEFIAERSQVSRGIIEVLYLLRCSLMHGEVFPDNNAMEVYKYAYSILAAILKKMF